MANNPHAALYELVRLGRYTQAKDGLARVVARKPDDHFARMSLAECMFWTGQAPAARFHLKHLIAQKDLRDDLLSRACDLVSRIDDKAIAIDALERRRAADPAAVHTRLALTALYMAAAKLDEAQRVFAEVENEFKDMPSVMRLKAGLLSQLGDVEGAVAAYRKCVWQDPNDLNLMSALAFILNGSTSATHAEVYQAHARFGETMAHEAGDGGFDFTGRWDPQRRLRVAFVSHDVNGHSVASFLEAPLRALPRDGFEVHLYHTGVTRDGTTDRLAACADRFEYAPGVTSIDLAARIYAQRTDVLIELNGHTQGHRLHAMQLRPAPLAATYLGYPATTGLRTIDLRLVDAVTDPPGAESFHSEQLVRLPGCFLCYTPVDQVPQRVGKDFTRSPRSTRDGRPVFCCFNGAHKVNDMVIALWSRVLAAVPEAAMLVKSRGASGPFSTEGMRARFAARGVDPRRIEIAPFTDSAAEHLNTYAGADIQLDTHPYNGTTTTCESLLMGVPVVAMAGDRHASRVSASLLTAAGLPELVARDEDSLVRIATGLALDTPRLRALQAGLPARLKGSILCDAPRFGQALGEALREAWRLRCAQALSKNTAARISPGG